MKRSIPALAVIGALIVGSTTIQADDFATQTILVDPYVSPYSATSSVPVSNKSNYNQTILLTESTSAEEAQSQFPEASLSGMKELYPYALMSYFANSYKTTSKNPEKNEALQVRMDILKKAGFEPLTRKEELPAVWQTHFDNETQRLVMSFFGLDLKMRFYRNDNDNLIVASIAGTDFSNYDSVKSAFDLANGSVPFSAHKAQGVVNELQKKYPAYDVVMTGVSQGGAIAQYVVANTNNTTAIVFNSEFLHPSLSQNLNNKRVKHSFVQGEALNDSSYLPTWALVRNPTIPNSTVLPVNEELSTIITNKYYRYETSGNSLSMVAGLLGYYTSSPGYVRHWAWAVVETIEHHIGQTLPSPF